MQGSARPWLLGDARVHQRRSGHMRLLDKHKFEEIKASGALPTPQGVALAILEVTRDENAKIEQIARLVKTDPALTSRLIRAANAANRAGNRPVASIADALTVLGISAVKRLALGFSLVSRYRKGVCAGFDYQRFWSRSLLMAIVMPLLGRHARCGIAEELFVCGLLSRVGQLALVTIYPNEYAELLRQHEAQPGSSVIVLEQQLLGTAHDELTAAMMSDWGLPRALVEPVACHETGDSDEFPPGSRAAVLYGVMRTAALWTDAVLGAAGERPTFTPELIAAAALAGLSAETIASTGNTALDDWQEWSGMLEIEAPPAWRGDAAEDADDPTDGRPPGADLLRILVADADGAAAASLKTLLTARGYSVRIVSDGREALSGALHWQPHIIVTESRMPNLDGLALCRALRGTDFGRGIYVLMLTGEGDAKILEAFEAGVDDCVGKPLRPGVLAARLRAAERMVSLQQQIINDRDDIRRFAGELATANRKLRETASIDALTTIPNRAYGLDYLNHEWAAAERHGRPLACMVIDIDYFKSINDSHGHDVGDAALKHIALLMQRATRAQDILCRFGGEEFLLVCPDTDIEAAARFGERLRREVAESHVMAGHSSIDASISVGIAAKMPGMSGPVSLLKSADRALYAAKQGGRNRCIVAPVPSPGADALRQPQMSK